jgi:hypothetical protein
VRIHVQIFPPIRNSLVSKKIQFRYNKGNLSGRNSMHCTAVDLEEVLLDDRPFPHNPFFPGFLSLHVAIACLDAELE